MSLCGKNPDGLPALPKGPKEMDHLRVRERTSGCVYCLRYSPAMAFSKPDMGSFQKKVLDNCAIGTYYRSSDVDDIPEVVGVVEVWRRLQKETEPEVFWSAIVCRS